MKPNYEEMNRADLKAYVLEHRDDLEAMRFYFNDPNVQWVTMPPLFENGQPVEENIRFAEEMIRKRAEEDDQRKRDSE